MSWGVHAQDIMFSQFYNAPIQLNPGLVGLSSRPHITANYRDQWLGWNNGGYNTYAASYDQFFDAFNSGLGVQVLSDNAGEGILVSNYISGVYSYRLQLNKKLQVRVGLEAGLSQQRLDWNKLVFVEDLLVGGNMETPPDRLGRVNADLSLGAVLYSKDYYIGLSIKHLNAPDNRFKPDEKGIYSGLPSRLSIHAGWQIDLDGYNNKGFGSFFAPSILFVRQAQLSQLNAGGLYNRENLFVGAWLRHNLSNIDAAIFSAGLRTEWLKISYSFDLTLSSALIANTGGSHELGVVINLGAFGPQPSRYEDCFSIFR